MITGDRFLQGLKRRVTVPASQVLVNNTGMLQMADDVTRDKIVPLIMAVNQNFFIYRETIALVADQAEYQIPYRSIARGLRELKLHTVDSTGSGGTSNLPQIALEDAHLFPQSGVPSGFYFQGDRIVVLPTPINTSYELYSWYDLQPSQIVQTTDAARVASVSTNVVTCTSVPSTMTAGVLVDFIQGVSGCGTLAMDEAITNVSGTQITFASADDIPSTLVAGDYISIKQTTPVLQLPDEAQPLLETLTALRLLKALGDFDGASQLQQDAAQQETDLKKILQPRIEGEPTKIVNRQGLVRGKGFNYWRLRSGYYP